MANNSIRYSEGTDAILNTAAQLDSYADEFFNEYTTLYSLIEGDISTSWKGEDYEAFKTKVDAMKHYFETMRDTITEYATFLRNTAKAHEARMQDSRNQASNLSDLGG